MSRYNGHFHSKFMGCMIVGKLRDEGRQRDVTCYAINGEPDVVGYYDGTDTWVGSASTCGSKVVQQELRAVHAGEPREIEFGQTRQRMFDIPVVMGNPALEVMQDTARPRRRAVVASKPPPPPNPPPTARRRVVAVPATPVRERRRAS